MNTHQHTPENITAESIQVGSSRTPRFLKEMVLATSVLVGGCMQHDVKQDGKTNAADMVLDKEDSVEKEKEPRSKVTISLPLTEELKKILNNPSVRMKAVDVKGDPSYIGVRVFLNLPTADVQTSIEDEHYVGSPAFYPATNDPHNFFLDAMSAIQALKENDGLKGDELTVTFVGIPLDKNDEHLGDITVGGVEFEYGALTPEDREALHKILHNEKMWNEPLSNVLQDLRGWQSIDQKTVQVFPKYTVSSSSYDSMEDAKNAVTTLQKFAPKAETFPFFDDDDSLRIKVPTDAVFSNNMKMKTVHELFGEPENIERKLVSREEDRRPVMLTIYWYVHGSIAFVGSDLSGPDTVDRVILDVERVSSIVQEKEGQ